MVQQSFTALEVTPHLHEIIRLKNITVHIVGQREFFEWEKAVNPGSNVAGYATSENEIYIFGKIVNGKIIVNQAVLGHELNHLLNFKNQNIANPDSLDDLGV